MSFSSQIKEELACQVPSARHCQLAELSAVLMLAGKLVGENGNIELQIHAEADSVRKKYFTILEKAFNIEESEQIVTDNQMIRITDPVLVQKIYQAVKQWDETTGYLERDAADSRLIQSGCCRRAFLRGCFLASGSVSAPEKFYHLEIVCAREAMAVQIRDLLIQYGMDAKIVVRKRYYVVYLKEGDQIADVFRIIEAPKAVIEFEQIRVMKDVRNRINRGVNCETANMNKTASAAVEQIEAIEYIRDRFGLESLPVNLRLVAEARLENPEASLKELAQVLGDSVGKSGINHRLRKIKAIADQHRYNKEEE